MVHHCEYQSCLDNVHGYCYAGGCRRNPAPEPEPVAADAADDEEEGGAE